MLNDTLVATPAGVWSAHDQCAMLHALSLAERAAAEGEVPVGAVVSWQDRIIATGYNQPIQLCDPSAHAEVQALRAAARQVHNYRLPQCTLYCTLEPCMMCCGLLIYARIRRLVFATVEEKTGAVVSTNSLLTSESVLCQYGLMAAHSRSLLRDFFQARRTAKA